MMGTGRPEAVYHLIDNINDTLCRWVSWFTLAMVITMLLIVVLRYGFDLGWIAMQESVMYLHAAVFLLGSAHTLRVNEHVRVDIFYRRFSPNKKAVVDIVGSVLFLLPVNIFIFIVSYDYVISSWQILEDSREAGGIPAVFILKSFILLFAAIMVCQGVAEILKNLVYLLKHSQADNGQGKR
jgi:TRAP-type mannitol/chloroaromatic compound transport system permease small subunit